MARVYWRNDKQEWWIDFVDADGVRHREKGGVATSKRAAEIELAQKRLDVERSKLFGEDEDRKIVPTSFREYSAIYLDTYAKVHKDTWKDDEYMLGPAKEFFDKEFLHRITHERIGEFFATLKSKELADSRINRYRTLLNRMYTLAIAAKRARTNPIANVPKFSEPRPRVVYADEALLGKLLEHSPLWMKEIILFAVLTGMREGEIFSITLDDIDLGLGRIFVGDNKEEDEKYVTLSEQGAILVRHLLAKPRSPDCKYLFFSDITGDKINLTSGQGRFRTAWDTARIAAGAPQFKFHWLRKTHGSYLAMLGVDMKAIQQQLGHSKYELTASTYAHLSPAHRNSAISRIDSVIKVGTYLAPGKPV